MSVTASKVLNKDKVIVFKNPGETPKYAEKEEFLTGAIQSAFPIAQQEILEGTVVVNPGDNAINGSNTFFTKHFKRGDVIFSEGNYLLIAEVESDTVLGLFDDSTVSLANTKYKNGGPVQEFLDAEGNRIGAVSEKGLVVDKSSRFQELRANSPVPSTARVPYITGTLTITLGSPNVVGVGTKFVEEVREGQVLWVEDANAFLLVDAINSDTSLGLLFPFPGATTPGSKAKFLPNPIRVINSLGELVLDIPATGKMFNATGLQMVALGTSEPTIGLPFYNKAALPTAALPGQFIYVMDDVGGPTPAHWNGAFWGRTSDNAPIS